MDTDEHPLRKARLAQDQGLRETARMAGMSPAHLSQVERGLKGISLSALARLAPCIGLGPGDIARLMRKLNVQVSVLMLMLTMVGLTLDDLRDPERVTITPRECFALLSLSKNLGWKAIHNGEIPGVLRLGSRYLISTAALLRWLDADAPRNGATPAGTGASDPTQRNGGRGDRTP